MSTADDLLARLRAQSDHLRAFRAMIYPEPGAGPVSRICMWLHVRRLYRADRLAQQFGRLPWVESRRDALYRAEAMRQSDADTLATLAPEMLALGLDVPTPRRAA